MFIIGLCFSSHDQQPILFWLLVCAPILMIAYINLIVSSINIIAVSIYQSFLGNRQLLLLILQGTKAMLRQCFVTSIMSDETTIDDSAWTQESGDPPVTNISLGRIFGLLPTYRYQKEATDDGPMCCICKEVFQPGDSIMQLPVCSHILHGTCGSKWFQMSMTCPICRSRVDTYMDKCVN